MREVYVWHPGRTMSLRPSSTVRLLMQAYTVATGGSAGGSDAGGVAVVRSPSVRLREQEATDKADRQGNENAEGDPSTAIAEAEG